MVSSSVGSRGAESSPPVVRMHKSVTIDFQGKTLWGGGEAVTQVPRQPLKRIFIPAQRDEAQSVR